MELYLFSEKLTQSSLIYVCTFPSPLSCVCHSRLPFYVCQSLVCPLCLSVPSLPSMSVSPYSALLCLSVPVCEFNQPCIENIQEKMCLY